MSKGTVAKNYFDGPIEVAIGSDSPFWRLFEPIDPNGDPLDLLIRMEDGDEIALSIMRPRRVNTMNYLNHIANEYDENRISKAALITAVRSVTNLCHGNLQTISSVRLANIEKRGDADTTRAMVEGTMDQPAGELNDEVIANERAVEQGFNSRLTVTQRGDCFASIRQACFDLAQERGFTGYDEPRNFKDYLEGRISRLKTGSVSAADIDAVQKRMLGYSKEQAKAFAEKVNNARAENLEKNAEAVLAEDSSYETDIDFEEACGLLGWLFQQRMRVKVIDGIMYEVKRIDAVLLDHPTFQELIDKRNILVLDALVLENELKVFEKTHRATINKELSETGWTPTTIARDHQNAMDYTRRMVALQNSKESA